jgi:ComF family protein
MNPMLKSLIMFLYPSQCRHCDENLDPSDGHYICKSCWDKVEFIKRPYCETCGYPLDPLATLPDRIASCAHCPGRPWFRKARSIAVYDSAVGEAIRLLKYSGKITMAKPLADMMVKAVSAFFGMEGYDYIIPVPIHKKKRRERGYNQMELIGRKLSQAIGIPMEMRSFIKTVNTPSQTSRASHSDRLENVRGTFGVRDPSSIADKRILLIDDVLTSGATVNESARTLAREGKVKCVDALTLSRRMQTEQV